MTNEMLDKMWDYSSCHFSIAFAGDWYLSNYIEFKLSTERKEGKISLFNSKYTKTEMLFSIIPVPHSMICLLIHKIGVSLFLSMYLL